MIRLIMNLFGIQVAVAGIVVYDGKILLTRRASLLVEGGKWCLPGGRIKKWEIAENAMKRELKEEVGLDAKKLKLLFVHDEIVRRLGLHAHVFVFKIDVFGEIKPNWEVSNYGWFSKKEIDKLSLAFTHRQVVDKYFNLKRK